MYSLQYCYNRLNLVLMKTFNRLNVYIRTFLGRKYISNIPCGVLSLGLVLNNCEVY
jgi:hypothetical protein